MAARNKLTHDEKTRMKIQASQLINRLESHALGDVELKMSQIKAIEILLKKTIPDLQSIELSGGESPVQFVVSAQPMMSAQEWLEKYK